MRHLVQRLSTLYQLDMCTRLVSTISIHMLQPLTGSDADSRLSQIPCIQNTGIVSFAVFA